VSLHVLFEDRHLAAVDKVPGRIVVPGRGVAEVTLREEAEALLGKLWVVHRLDRGTSGVLLFARTAEAHRSACQAFEHHQVSKRYLALVRGLIDRELRVDVPIAAGRRGRMRVFLGAGGRPSATFVRPLTRFSEVSGMPGMTLVEAFPESGRTHQVRVHLAHIGHPLAVDPDYGEAEPLCFGGRALLSRTPLHAASIELLHPVEGRPLRIEAPLPRDMEETIAVAAGGDAPQASKRG
jgi:RluA family pseudouridine synthase